MSVIKQIVETTITLRDGRNQANIGTYLWQDSNFSREFV